MSAVPLAGLQGLFKNCFLYWLGQRRQDVDQTVPAQTSTPFFFLLPRQTGSLGRILAGRPGYGDRVNRGVLLFLFPRKDRYPAKDSFLKERWPHGTPTPHLGVLASPLVGPGYGDGVCGVPSP